MGCGLKLWFVGKFLRFLVIFFTSSRFFVVQCFVLCALYLFCFLLVASLLPLHQVLLFSFLVFFFWGGGGALFDLFYRHRLLTNLPKSKIGKWGYTSKCIKQE